MLRATISGSEVTTPEGILTSPVVISLSGTAGQTPAARLLIDGNMLFQDGLPPALLIETPDPGTAPVLDATVSNNHIDMLQIGTTVPDDPSFHGPIGMVMRASQAAANLCANIHANTAHWNPTETTTPAPNDLEGGISVEQSGGATFRLERGVEPLGTPRRGQARRRCWGRSRSSTAASACCRRSRRTDSRWRVSMTRRRHPFA
jgi:hypothetical protein